jgi:hypothetical protein
VVLAEFTILALNLLRMAVWAMPVSALKLGLITGTLWIMTPCHGFDKTYIIEYWGVFGLSLVIMVYSYFIWVRYQRLSIHRKREPYQVGGRGFVGLVN